MDKFLNYLKEVISSPKKAFKRISQDKNLKPYILYIIIYQIIFGLINRLLFSPQSAQFSEKLRYNFIYKKIINGYVLYFAYSPLTTIIMWFCSISLSYLIIRIFSKKGSFASLIVSQGYITMIFGTIVLVLQLINKFVSSPLLSTITSGISIWIIYLNVLAISIIFSVSKLKSLLIILTVYAILITLLISSFIFLLTKV